MVWQSARERPTSVRLHPQRRQGLEVPSAVCWSERRRVVHVCIRMSRRAFDVFTALPALVWLAATSFARAQEPPPPTSARPAPPQSPFSATAPPAADENAIPAAPREAQQALEAEEPAEAYKRP